MFLIDTHAHLYLDAFENERHSVIKNAADAGVKYILLPNIDSGSILSVHTLADEHPGICYPMMGLHPTSVAEDFREQLKTIERELGTREYSAVGEIGIDLYWDKTHQREQEEAFDIQLGWAEEHDLPVAIHMRDSFEALIQVLKLRPRPGLRGVFHCFSGDREQAMQVVGMGFLLGIGGVITFKNSGLSAAIRDIPRDKIVLETDAPFLAPMPYRGKRNESAYIPLIAGRLAETWQCSVEEVARITTTNACQLFNLHNPYKDA